jgi:hypothetical protein
MAFGNPGHGLGQTQNAAVLIMLLDHLRLLNTRYMSVNKYGSSLYISVFS